MSSDWIAEIEAPDGFEKYDNIINVSSCKYTYNLPIHKDFIKKKNNP